MTFVEWFLGSLLFLVVVYLSIRFGSTAYYKSKKEYQEWYRTHFPTTDRRKGES